MTENGRFQSKRSRTVLGLVVVAISIGLAVALAGVSFAQNSSTNAAQYQYGKIVICHHTGSKKHPRHTITISQNAWKAHQKHGDTLGPCPPATPANSPAKGKAKGKSKSHAPVGSTTPANPTTPGNSGNNGKSGDKGKPADTPGKGKGK